MEVSGTITQEVQMDFIGGSGGSPLSFPGLGCSLLMSGTVPESVFPNGREGREVHVTVTAYGVENGLREKICLGQVNPVLGNGEKKRELWEKGKEKWLKKASTWLQKDN